MIKRFYEQKYILIEKNIVIFKKYIRIAIDNSEAKIKLKYVLNQEDWLLIQTMI